jgi:transcriptional regulator with XRE-family HTH domain
MPEPHTRLDQAMTARSLELGKRWVQIARDAGITTSALSGIRRGEYRPSALTARRLEDALRWEYGSIDAILDGGQPTPSGGVPPASGHPDDTLTGADRDEELRQLFDEAEGDPVLRDALLSVARLREERRRPPDNDNGGRRRQPG